MEIPLDERLSALEKPPGGHEVCEIVKVADAWYVDDCINVGEANSPKAAVNKARAVLSLIYDRFVRHGFK
eukprot:3505230-Lingulodinium_polyedra.AAC.1